MIIRIHVSLILVCIYLVFIGKTEIFFISYMFIIMHELGHMIISLLLNVDIEEISLMPFGVNAKYVRSDSKLKELIISIAGPVTSLILGYIYNNELYFTINLLIIIFNLIPIYPLDGGRVLRVILKFFFGNKYGIKVSTYITNIIIIISFLLGLFLAAYYKIFSLLILTLYLIKISKDEIKKDKILSAINYLQTNE